MNGNVDRLLEAIRQRALVRSGRLHGQVECRGSHDWWGGHPLPLPCSECKAAV